MSEATLEAARGGGRGCVPFPAAGTNTLCVSDSATLALVPTLVPTVPTPPSVSSSVSAASTDSPARNTLRNLNVHPHPRKSSCCLSGWATPGHRGGRTSRRWRSGCTCTAGIRAGASVTPLASSPCGARANPGLEPKAVYGSACGRPLSWSTRWTRIARCDRRSWKAGRLTGHRIDYLLGSLRRLGRGHRRRREILA